MIENSKSLTIIKKALKDLAFNENTLINRKPKEECINHRFAVYLGNHFEKEFKNKSNLSVDLEYSKNLEDPKFYVDENGHEVKFRPDILIHKRYSNEDNLMAIELKFLYLTKKDKNSIKGLLSEPYNYEEAYGISYMPYKDHFIITKFELDSEGKLKVSKDKHKKTS